MKFLLNFFASLALGVSVVEAQAQPTVEVVKATVRTVWASASAPGEIGLVDGVETPQFKPIPVSTLAFGAPVEYKGSRLMRFSRKSPDGKFSVIGEIVVPVGMSEMIALLAPEPGPEGKVKVILAPDSLMQFPTDSFVLVNFTRVAIPTRFAGKDFSLAPGLNRPLTYNPAEKPEPVLQMAVKMGDEVVPLMNKPMSFTPHTRGFLFVAPSPRAGVKSVLTFFVRDPRDYRPRKPVAAP